MSSRNVKILRVVIGSIILVVFISAVAMYFIGNYIRNNYQETLSDLEVELKTREAKKEVEDFLSTNKKDYVIRLGDYLDIKSVEEKINLESEIVWKNKADSKNLKFKERVSFVTKKNADTLNFLALRFEAVKVGTETVVIGQCKTTATSVYTNCTHEQTFNVKVIANEPLSKEVPPNGTFIFTVDDFEAEKNGTWKLVIKGNSVEVYSEGNEIWNKDEVKGTLLMKLVLVKFKPERSEKARWILVQEEYLHKNLDNAPYSVVDFDTMTIYTG